jgi:hypothetical protein
MITITPKQQDLIFKVGVYLVVPAILAFMWLYSPVSRIFHAKKELARPIMASLSPTPKGPAVEPTNPQEQDLLFAHTSSFLAKIPALKERADVVAYGADVANYVSQKARDNGLTVSKVEIESEVMRAQYTPPIKSSSQLNSWPTTPARKEGLYPERLAKLEVNSLKVTLKMTGDANSFCKLVAQSPQWPVWIAVAGSLVDTGIATPYQITFKSYYAL